MSTHSYRRTYLRLGVVSMGDRAQTAGSCGPEDTPVKRISRGSQRTMRRPRGYRNPFTGAGIRVLELKRTTGLEPATPGLGSQCSTD